MIKDKSHCCGFVAGNKILHFLGKIVILVNKFVYTLPEEDRRLSFLAVNVCQRKFSAAGTFGAEPCLGLEHA